MITMAEVQNLVWFLRRQYKDTEETITLTGRQEVSLGRGLDVTHRTIPKDTPFNMFSRKHAIFRPAADGTWTVQDNNTINGIFINGHRLKPGIPVALKEGDNIQLGLPPTRDSEPEFLYRIVRDYTSNISGNRTDSELKSKRKETAENADPQGSRPGPSHHRPVESSGHKRRRLEQLDEDLAHKQREKQAEQRVKEAEARIQKMQSLIEEKELAQKALQEEMKKKEQEMQQERRQQMVRLEEEKQQMQADLQAMMTLEMQQKEQELLQRLEQQSHALQEEKQQVEERLQQQLAQQLEEKDKDLEEQLLKHKAALDQIISQKEREHSDLQAKLLQSKLEKEQQEQSVKKVREEVVENVTNVMESELQCNICTELFVQATTLHCSHTFCYACILEWTKTRKMECPTCRTKVTSKTRSLVLDSYIDKMVESYSEELKQHRMDLLQERKEKVATLERQSPRQGKDSPISVGSASSDEEPLSVGSNSSGSGSQWTQSSSSSHNSPPLHSRGGNSASMDNDFVQGDPMAYYGGYGRCHICGHRGHWARGCPFRYR
ncbi:E3 ubiquitin-protein ligase rnf8-like isoform X2 [Branchiostoma lanceolatum]|uniref:E3 ubiquitin-protein ligase rnf8-like isoform X2 n=1 Tax=Branchiostoma lanceolatum TaxID=7740 RepID=UPI003455D64C